MTRASATVAFLTLFIATPLFADLSIDIAKVAYEPHKRQIPGAPKATIKVVAKATTQEGNVFSVAGLKTKILRKGKKKGSWTLVSPSQRYAKVGEPGLADAIRLEPKQAKKFVIEINELTRGLDDDGEYLIVLWNDDAMAAIEFSKKSNTE